MKVFLDMDGVLVDFINGACRAHQVHNPYERDPQQSAGVWDIERLVGMSVDEFWPPLGKDFWANLNWMPDGQAILAAVEQKFGRDNICLLTSPCDTDGCADGKLAWIRRHLPEYRRRYFLGPPKEFAASANRILIDDSDHNCERFGDEGGSTILIPRPWNQLHHKASHDPAATWLRRTLGLPTFM